MAGSEGEGDEGDEVGGCLLSEREMAIRGEVIAETVFAHVNEVAELPDGYGFRFDDAQAHLPAILDLIAAERRCCPFLTFELAFPPNNGPLWLRLRGATWAKTFIAETFAARVGSGGAASGAS